MLLCLALCVCWSLKFRSSHICSSVLLCTESPPWLYDECALMSVCERRHEVFIGHLTLFNTMSYKCTAFHIRITFHCIHAPHSLHHSSLDDIKFDAISKWLWWELKEVGPHRYLLNMLVVFLRVYSHVIDMKHKTAKQFYFYGFSLNFIIIILVCGYMLYCVGMCMSWNACGGQRQHWGVPSFIPPLLRF